MPPPLLTFLKYLFLVLLYLFFLRVLRAVWVELREPKVAEGATPPASSYDQTVATHVPPESATSGGAPSWAAPPSLAQPSPWAPAAEGRTGVVAPPAPVDGNERQARLIVLSPQGSRGVVYQLGDELTVGRSPGCAIALPDDTYVSQMHARVFRRDGRWWVDDLGSTNGTLLNGSPVTRPAVIRPGDRLQFGQTVMGLEA